MLRRRCVVAALTGCFQHLSGRGASRLDHSGLGSSSICGFIAVGYRVRRGLFRSGSSSNGDTSGDTSGVSSAFCPSEVGTSRWRRDTGTYSCEGDFRLDAAVSVLLL